MRGSVRLIVRTDRVGLLAVVLGGAVAAIVIGLVATWMASMRGPAFCLDRDLRFTVSCLGEGQYLNAVNDYGYQLVAAATAFPYVAAVLMGALVVAPEIENGTATIAWWLARSRRRWLLERVAVFGVVLTAALAAVALAADLLTSANQPQPIDMSTAVFLDYGSRGVVAVARGLAIFAIATVVGLLVGRLVPALVIAAVIAAGMHLALGYAQFEALPPPEYVLVTPDHYVLDYTGVNGAPQAYLDPDGRQLFLKDIVAIAPYPLDDPRFDPWFTETFRPLSYAIPGERLDVVAWREVAALSAIGLGCLGFGLWAIERRRPT
jgi:hypothetical protein